MRTLKLKSINYLLPGLALVIMVMTAGCTNSYFSASRLNRSLAGGSSSTSTSTSTTSTSSTFVISNVIIAMPATSGTTTSTTPPTTTVYFDPNKSTAPISNVCSTSGTTGGTSMPCVCSFIWQEINQTTGTNITVQRSVQTSVLSVQNTVVTCNAPDVYNTDIPTGTLIKISVAPAPGASQVFSMNPFTYTKNTGAAAGSFQDAQGRSFSNIFHYACYEQMQRGMSITSRMQTATNPSSGETSSYYQASSFCIQNASGNSTSSPGCQNMPLPDYTAQSAYYNLYIRDSELGDINYSNLRYNCPTVMESLGGSSTTAGSSGLAWPLDSSFALSVAPTSDFPVGVEAITQIAGGSGSTTSLGSSCFPSTTSGSSGTSSPNASSGLVASCLGFAAKPNPDGTCPYLRNAAGQIVNTYRLRRYVALYPPVFDTTGKVLQNYSQPIDTIYVLDRPVYSASADPLKPYTMKGPKPCPFAYFDAKNVTGSADFSYIGTSNILWSGPNLTGTNVDGIELPNTDSAGSCSAVIPWVSPGGTVLSLATVNASNAVNPVTNFALRHVYIRPMQPWAPHYVEDTDFQACAPQSSQFRDPPLHFAKDTAGNVSWCAEDYPSQNGNIGALTSTGTGGGGMNGTYDGNIVPYTSHVVKNTTSNTCSATVPPIPTNYPGGALGAANHSAPGNTTCDRTTITPSISWAKFPLLAPAADIEAAMTNSADGGSYNCTITYDNGGSKTGKNTPAGGCCGTNVTGYPAHLEPDKPCLVPTY